MSTRTPPLTAPHVGKRWFVDALRTARSLFAHAWCHYEPRNDLHALQELTLLSGELFICEDPCRVKLAELPYLVQNRRSDGRRLV